MAGVVTLLLLACGEVGSGEEIGAAPSSVDRNPQGLEYPTDHVGTQQRQGTVRGDRIANLSFYGLRQGNVDAPLDTVTLAEHYDPEARDHRVLYLFVAAGWCAICASVASEMQREHEALRAAGARVVVVLVNGESQSRGPSLLDLRRWNERHPLPLDLLADSQGTKLGVYGLGGVPFNVLIDTRSMEILDATVGKPVSLPAYVGAGLDFTAQFPSSYP